STTLTLVMINSVDFWAEPAQRKELQRKSPRQARLMAQLPTNYKLQGRLGSNGRRVKQIQEFQFLFGSKKRGLKRVPRQLSQVLVSKGEFGLSELVFVVECCSEHGGIVAV